MNEFLSEILAVFFIGIGVFYFNRTITNGLDEKQFMVKSLFTILFMLVLLFISDKLFFSSRDLLSKDARVALFGLIEKILLLITGYYFGSSNQK